MKKRGSFSISPAQRFEYMFVRPQGVASWSTRAMILNIETGILLEYAEKSGKKVLKERYNVKGCELMATDTIVSDKERSMTLILSDKKQLQLAYETQEHFDEWLEYFKVFSNQFHIVNPPTVQPKKVLLPSPSPQQVHQTNIVHEHAKPNTIIEAKKPMSSSLVKSDQPRRKSDKEARVSFNQESPIQVITSDLETTVTTDSENEVTKEILDAAISKDMRRYSSSVPIQESVYDESPSNTMIKEFSVGFHSSSMNAKSNINQYDDEIYESEEPTLSSWPPADLRRVSVPKGIDDEKISQPSSRDTLAVQQPKTSGANNNTTPGDWSSVPLPQMVGEEVQFVGNNPLAKLRKPSFPQTPEPHYQASPRVSASPFEASQIVQEQLTSRSNTGSAISQAHMFSTDTVEYSEESSRDSLASSPALLSSQSESSGPRDRFPLEKKSSFSQLKDGIAIDARKLSNSGSGESRPSFERKPSVSRLVNPPELHQHRASPGDSITVDGKSHDEIRRIAESNTPLGEKRRGSDRRPSLSESLFGFEITSPTSKPSQSFPFDKTNQSQSNQPSAVKAKDSNDTAEMKRPSFVKQKDTGIDSQQIGKNFQEELKNKLKMKINVDESKDTTSTVVVEKSIDKTSVNHKRAVEEAFLTLSSRQGSSFFADKSSRVIENEVVAEETLAPASDGNTTLYRELFHSELSPVQSDGRTLLNDDTTVAFSTPKADEKTNGDFPLTPSRQDAPKIISQVTRLFPESNDNSLHESRNSIVDSGSSNMISSKMKSVENTCIKTNENNNNKHPIENSEMTNSTHQTPERKKDDNKLSLSLPVNHSNQRSNNHHYDSEQSLLIHKKPDLPSISTEPEKSIKDIVRRTSMKLPNEPLSPIAAAAAVAAARNSILSDEHSELDNLIQSTQQPIGNNLSARQNPSINNNSIQSQDVIAKPQEQLSLKLEETKPVTQPVDIDTGDDHLLIEVVGVLHPAHRLNRRVHIWNYSYGFSFEAIEDLHQFIYDIRECSDQPLRELSYRTQDTFLDWSETMNALREEEAKSAAELYNDSVVLMIDVTFMVGEEKITTQRYEIMFSESPSDLAAKIASETGFDFEFLKAQVNREVLKENNFYQQGYVYLQKTMLFAEDLFLYQEEIIDTLSREKVEFQQHLHQAEEAAQAAVTVAEENLRLVNEYKEKEKYEEERRMKDVKTKEQWEREKDDIMKQYELEKDALTNELRLLKQSSNPNADKVFADLRRNEVLLGSLEDQLVKSEMANDQLKLQLQIASERIAQLDLEKGMLEKEYQDQIAAIRGIGSQYGPNKPYYPVDIPVSESKENRNVLSPPKPLMNRNESFNERSNEIYVNPSVRLPTTTQLSKSYAQQQSFEQQKRLGLATFNGDPHPYLKFSSDPAMITKPQSPLSRLGKFKNDRLQNRKNVSSNRPVHRNYGQEFTHYVNTNIDYGENTANDQSTLSNDGSGHSEENGLSPHNKKLSPVELTRLLATRQQVIRNDNHPLRQALRHELPQPSNIQKQKEDEISKRYGNKYTLTPYQVMKTAQMGQSSQISPSDGDLNRDMGPGNNDRYLEGTDSSNKKSREISEVYHQIKRPGTVAWKV